MGWSNPWDEAARAKGHVLKLDDDGEVDHFALSGGYCNGPECELCGEAWCEHCTSADEIEPCTAMADGTLIEGGVIRRELSPPAKALPAPEDAE